ncbi:MAG TPA: FliM/FliN family flagellar motor C-terminal domain-containing protein, partial [Planctomycetota bacterium]|nr:FliM/FliN family flagellar motor C-terminal domain-containing protein [Planctomycetota bacterium]
IEVHVRAAEPTTLLVQLPVLGSPHLAAEKDGAPAVAALPSHLGGVACGLTVQLGGADISLADLLALEVGDVVELDARADRPVRVTVEGRGVATAVLGLSGARLAVRLLEPLPTDETDENES